MSYKVGDIVTIKSLKWYEKNKDFNGEVKNELYFPFVFTEEMTSYCGKSFRIVRVLENNSYRLDIDDACFSFFDDMFEPPQEQKVKIPVKFLGEI